MEERRGSLQEGEMRGFMVYQFSKVLAVISSREMKEGKGIYHALSLPHALSDTSYLLTQYLRKKTFSVLLVPPKG